MEEEARLNNFPLAGSLMEEEEARLNNFPLAGSLMEVEAS